jgi:hypothetical protein
MYNIKYKRFIYLFIYNKTFIRFYLQVIHKHYFGPRDC